MKLYDSLKNKLQQLFMKSKPKATTTVASNPVDFTTPSPVQDKRSFADKIVFEDIARENIGQIISASGNNNDKKWYVLAISFAEIGAMGAAGEVQIVIRDRDWNIKGYRTNYLSGIFEKSTDWQKEQEKLFEILPVLREIDFNRFVTDPTVAPIRGILDYGIWYVFDLGYGNHLLAGPFLDASMLHEYRGTPIGHMYEDWPRFVSEFAKNMKEELEY